MASSPMLDAVRDVFVDIASNITLLASIESDIAGLGSRPKFPVIVDTDASYTNRLSDQATYDSALSILFASRVSCRETLEILVYNTTQCNDGAGFYAPNKEWMQLTAATRGDFSPFPDTVWIGFDTRYPQFIGVIGHTLYTIPYFDIIVAAPQNPFPDRTPASVRP